MDLHKDVTEGSGIMQRRKQHPKSDACLGGLVWQSPLAIIRERVFNSMLLLSLDIARGS